MRPLRAPRWPAVRPERFFAVIIALPDGERGGPVLAQPYSDLTRDPMDQSNHRAFAARYVEPSGRRWVAEEVARLETVAASVDGPTPRLVLRFTSEDSLCEQRFTRCGPLRWTSPEIIEALFLRARPIRPIPEPTPPGKPRRRASRRYGRRNGPNG